MLKLKNEDFSRDPKAVEALNTDATRRDELALECRHVMRFLDWF